MDGDDLYPLVSIQETMDNHNAIDGKTHDQIIPKKHH